MIKTNLIDFPTSKVSACTVMTSDGCVAFVNTKNSSARQRKALRHELDHEDRDDFSRENIQVIESEAHS